MTDEDPPRTPEALGAVWFVIGGGAVGLLAGGLLGAFLGGWEAGSLAGSVIGAATGALMAIIASVRRR